MVRWCFVTPCRMPRSWPFYGLVLRTPRLELRLPTLDEVEELIDAARAGVHDPAMNPFVVPWTSLPSPELERNVLQFHLRSVGEWTLQRWRLALVAWHDGRVVGSQDLSGERFGVRREVETGSWLTRSVHGRGLGKEMRCAILTFAFDHLDARWATSTARDENIASRTVSTRLGYEDDGLYVFAPGDEVHTGRRYRISRDRWLDPHEGDYRCPVDVRGVTDEVRELCGLPSR